MAVDIKGFVFSKEQLDQFNALDKIKAGIYKFFHQKLKSSIKKENPEDYLHMIISLYSLSKEERDKFSFPVIEYNGGGLFKAILSFPSPFNKNGFEMREVSIFTNLNENDNLGYARHIGIDFPDKDIMKEFKSGIWLSMGMSGSAPDLIVSILKEFGDQLPSYLIRNDCADVFAENAKIVVKIGDSEENISPVAIDEKEYMKIRRDEMQRDINKFKKRSNVNLFTNK